MLDPPHRSASSTRSIIQSNVAQISHKALPCFGLRGSLLSILIAEVES